MSKPRTTSIELTLEESGVLYHLLLRSLLDTGVLSSSGDFLKIDKLSQRLAALLKKLGDANDKLMGKT